MLHHAAFARLVGRQGCACVLLMRLLGKSVTGVHNSSVVSNPFSMYALRVCVCLYMYHSWSAAAKYTFAI